MRVTSCRHGTAVVISTRRNVSLPSFWRSACQVVAPSQARNRPRPSGEVRKAVKEAQASMIKRDQEIGGSP
jgi:hypothetical protein